LAVLASLYSQKNDSENFTWYKGGIIRGDTTIKNIYLVFTGDEFGDGGDYILSTLKKYDIKASFFFTGRFYEQPHFAKLVKQLKKAGHYLGAHSDKHLLYCDWNNRDSLFVTKEQFRDDLMSNYDKMKKFSIAKKHAKVFLPPFEWYNDSIARWTIEMGLQLINYSPGTLSHADYTIPGEKNYRTSQVIYESILNFEKNSKNGLNGFIILMHIGTDPQRSDKFYYRLPELLNYLKNHNYTFKKTDHLLLSKSL
jgi:peptidoglycan/xylan/chitin deacetylase (PgdA/CDA1 family)